MLADIQWSDTEPDADPIFLNKTIVPAPSHLNAKQLPDWCNSNVKNHLDLIPTSNAHFMAKVRIDDNVVLAIIDTGGARTMMDKTVA